MQSLANPVPTDEVIGPGLGPRGGRATRWKDWRAFWRASARAGDLPQPRLRRSCASSDTRIQPSSATNTEPTLT